MNPGEHFVVIGTEIDALQARAFGFHLCDTIHIVLPGPRMLSAFLFRAPLEGTIAENVLRCGHGGINIDQCRVAHPGGRWPTNLVLVHAPGCRAECEATCPARVLDEQSGYSVSHPGGISTKALGLMNDDSWVAQIIARAGHADSGGASRFFPQFPHLRAALEWLQRLVGADPQQRFHAA